MARLPTEQGPVVIKWFGWRHPIHFYLSPFSAGRAWTSWEMAMALQELGTRTPEPLFVYSRRRRGFIDRNFFISSAIHPHKTLRALLKSNAPAELKERVVTDLAHSIARMHGGGILHRDLTSGNFLVDEEGLVYLVDLNRARRPGALTLRRRLADLARISFAARDEDSKARLTRRFFQMYGTETDLSIDWERGYWQARRRRLSRQRWKKRLRRVYRRK